MSVRSREDVRASIERIESTAEAWPDEALAEAKRLDVQLEELPGAGTWPERRQLDRLLFGLQQRRNRKREAMLKPPPRWKRILQSPWWWPLPAVLLESRFLVAPSAWEDGRAQDALFAMLLGVGIYAASFLPFFRYIFGGRPGMRPPTETERGCAVWMVRIAALGGYTVLAVLRLFAA